MKKDNLKKRRKFSRKVAKILTDKFWEEGISFYIDAAEFQHKYNPHDELRSIRTMAWQLKNESLHPHCAAKGSHVGSGRRVAHLIMAIAHQKSVVLCEHYEGKINGYMFSDFMRTHFQEIFSRYRIPKGKRFLQDRCPVQNSSKARQALDTIGAFKFSIPPRSSDFNSIKCFSFCQKWTAYSDTQTFEKNINYGTFGPFSARVRQALENTPTKYIDKIIESMGKRMLKVIKSKGERINIKSEIES